MSRVSKRGEAPPFNILPPHNREDILIMERGIKGVR